jgi:transposase
LGVKVTLLFGVSNTLLYVVQHKRIRTLLLRIKLSHVPVFGAGSLYCIFSFYIELNSFCSVLNKLTLQKSKIKMKYSKKKYNYYSDDERMSYIREYLSSPESKSEFCKRHGFCAKLLTYWLNKYQIEDKDMGRSSKPVNSDAIDSSISELQKELSLLRAENRKLHRALADESLRHEACEELINLAESTYHIKVRKNSDAK